MRDLKNEPEALRQRLLTACAFARVFIAAADSELRGGDGPGWRADATEQLQAALRCIEPPAGYLTTKDASEVSRVRSIREEFDKERAGWEPFESL